MSWISGIVQAATGVADWWLDKRDEKREAKKARDLARAEELLARSLDQIEEGIRWFEQFRPKLEEANRKRAEALERAARSKQ